MGLGKPRHGCQLVQWLGTGLMYNSSGVGHLETQSGCTVDAWQRTEKKKKADHMCMQGLESPTNCSKGQDS